MFQVSSIINHFPYVGLFLLLLLGEIGFPFPEDATLLLSGFLVAHGMTKLIPTLLVVYGGLLVTDFSLYLIGKNYGRRLFEHKTFQNSSPLRGSNGSRKSSSNGDSGSSCWVDISSG